MISPKIKITAAKPKDAPEVVKLDLRGERKMVFARDVVTFASNEIFFPLDLPFVVNEPLAYRDIEWVGVARKKQRWTLVSALIFGPLGLFWMVNGFGNWGEFAFGTFFFLVLGVIPLRAFLRGRPFLVVATPFAAIGMPMDRQRRKVRRIVDLLRVHCPETVRWDLQGLAPGALSSGQASPKIDEHARAEPAIPASSD